MEEAVADPGPQLVVANPTSQTNTYEGEDWVLNEYPSTQSAPGYKSLIPIVPG